MSTDDRWGDAMARALELAARSPVPDPNPRVGCVLVDDSGRVMGEGWHHGAGSPHAEIEALRSVGGPLPRGVTAVVTLEPCNHTGRTGPCSRALIDAGVSRVVIGLADPNPVAAGGAEALRRAGVEVVEGVLAEEAAGLNEDWLFAVRHGRPRVVWKYAATLDGRSAAADGTSRWITSEPARREVHRERARCGAVMVGTGTVLADDPQLTVRGVDVTRQPLRVVVGRREIPEDRQVLDDRAPTLLIHEHDPAAVLAVLHERGVHRVWLEGGPHLAGAFWAAGLVDEVVAHLAPALLGAGPAALQDAGVVTIAGAHRLVIDDVSMLGPDIQVRAHPARTAEGPGRSPESSGRFLEPSSESPASADGLPESPDRSPESPDRSPEPPDRSPEPAGRVVEPPGTQCGAQRRAVAESVPCAAGRHIAYRGRGDPAAMVTGPGTRGPQATGPQATGPQATGPKTKTGLETATHLDAQTGPGVPGPQQTAGTTGRIEDVHGNS